MKTSVFIVLSIALFASCSYQTKPPSLSEIVLVTKDDNFVQSLFDDIQLESDKQHASTPLNKEMDATGPTVTFDAGENGYQDSAWTITIDFGDGMIGRFGWERKGKIHVDVKGFYKQKGATRVMTFDNYYVNNHKVDGVHTVTNLGFDSLQMAYVFDVRVENGIVLTSDSKQITWESLRTRKWTAGYNTAADLSDDVYEISGTVQGINSAGKSFTKEIIEPLVIYYGCEYIQTGKVETIVEQKDPMIIDFGYSQGSSNCDEYAKIYIGKNGYAIKLAK